MTVFGLNLLFLEERPLTGPGYYAVEVAERLIEPIAATGDSVIAYVQEAALHHLSPALRARCRTLPSLGGRVSRVLCEQMRLPLRTRRDGIDVLFSPAFVSPLWGARRLVATVHDMYYRAVPEVVERHQRRYWSVMIPATARACDHLITVSQNSKRDMVRYLPITADDVSVTPLASRMTAGRTAEEPSGISGPYLLSVANLTPNKNIAGVVRAVATARAEGLPYRLVHVGLDLNGELERAVAQHGAAGWIDRLGKVGEARLAGLYREAFATIVASFYEGFGMPAVEAQAMRSPLLCSSASALPEAAGEGALFFDPSSPRAIADAIRRLHDEPGLREALIAKGSANAAARSWQQTADLTLAVLRKVAAK